MTTSEPPEDPSKKTDSASRQQVVSRITWIEVLIIVAIIAALVAFLPEEWNR